VLIVVRSGGLGVFPSPRERPRLTVVPSGATRDADEDDAAGKVRVGEGVFPTSVSTCVEIGN
jgi:hypothetical protein